MEAANTNAVTSSDPICANVLSDLSWLMMGDSAKMLMNVGSLVVAVNISVRTLMVDSSATACKDRHYTSMENLAFLWMDVIETMEDVSTRVLVLLMVTFSVVVILDFNWLMTASRVKNWICAR